MFYVGIDGGGTKSEFVLMNDENEILNKSISGATNINSHGYDCVKESLSSGIKKVLEAFEVDMKDVVVCLCSAGIDQPSDKMQYEAILKDMNIKAFDVMNDSEGALAAGTDGEDGIIVISGTGSIVMGKKQEITKRAGGWGHVIGDEGSAYHIAIEGIKKVLQSHDGYGLPTVLEPMLLEAIQAPEVSHFIDYIYKRNFSKDRIAALSEVVDAAANTGDQAAIGVLKQDAYDLSLQVRGVINNLFGLKDPIKLVLNGSVIQKSKCFYQFFKEHLSDLEHLEFVFLDKSAAVGAAYLAKRMVKYEKGIC